MTVQDTINFQLDGGLGGFSQMLPPPPHTSASISACFFHERKPADSASCSRLR